MGARASRLAPDERREAIVDAVLPLLLTHPGELTTRQIAEAAGIAEGTIFRAFEDKRAVLLAAAERAVSPPGWRTEMEEQLAALPDLASKVRATIVRMRARMRESMLVLGALRSTLAAEPLGAGHSPPGPPAFLVEAGRQNLDAITVLVFGPHRDELRVSPEVAARTLRSLVMGGVHPGAVDGDLSAEELVAILLYGIAR